MVRTVEEAAIADSGYDYVFVCVKALPDIYKLGDVIRPVITPSHTCIIVNTTAAIGIEEELMGMYPRNMVLSLCSGVEILQTGPADFDHTALLPVHIGALKENPNLPQEAQQDMTESLTLTMEAGAVACSLTTNIEKHQWERLLGPIALHPISVILKEPVLSKLLEEAPIAQLINDVFDECLRIAEQRGTTFPYDFKARILSQTSSSKETKSPMYQDFLAGRPLEIEVYLLTPIRFAERASISVPNLKSVYAMLNHLNIINQQHPPSPVPQLHARLAPQLTGQSHIGNSRPHMIRGATDGLVMNGGRAMSMVYGPPPNSGQPRSSHPQSRRQPVPVSRQDSLEGLEEFAAVAMYNDMVPGGGGQYQDPRIASDLHGEASYAGSRMNRSLPTRSSTAQGYHAPQQQSSQRLPRQGAFAAMGQKMSAMRLSSRGKAENFDDDDDDDDYVDVTPTSRGPPVDPDQVDMMSMTRRARNSAMSQRNDSDGALFNSGRSKPRQSKSSAQALMNDIPGIHDTVTSTALFGMGDNRYGTVDSRSLAKSANSRLNTMQSERLNSISSVQPSFNNGTSYPIRQTGPPNAMNGRGPYPPNAVSYRGPQSYSVPTQVQRGQPPQRNVPRQQIPAGDGVYPPKAQEHIPQGTRSVTGSASASFGSLGNGSNSHSSSSSRDDLPPVPR